ncbi:Adenine specific DNA methylase Mod [Halomonas sp. A3H3]|uniref:site-specific DNA-methyltransferase n=1 Tax=Halomonas sp. A3H3 TaxID=1346287 RepID=UPI00038DBE4C|nr:DNA methyltransferase [Halomonas sp. A3H3]CDG56175.1 Adenine specific DNA methylase Mod [Halomonas sp. A3H3]
MSRLTDLIADLKAKDPKLGADLDREFKVLSSRLPFGLNFERHRPEAVELPLRPIRKGDKVRVLPPRGSTKKGDQRLWQVKAIRKNKNLAEIELTGGYEESEAQSVSLENLVVVADFRDTIFPGLISTGKEERAAHRKPFHTVINGENYHALKALTFTHRGAIDLIYIDPPYNSGAKDWKYNNNYVESDDLYRHSKWLAFMERRLNIAKELLDPENSVLILAIDEKEYLRLGLLLEQMFPEAKIEMVTSVVNPRGRHRPGRFARSEEYIYFVMFGESVVGKELDPDFEGGSAVPWRTLRRSDASSARGTAKGGPAQFYPIYVDATGNIKEIGDPLPHGAPRNSAPEISGCEAVFPIRDNGLEMNWGLTAPALKSLLRKGYVRVGRHRPSKSQKWEISYLTSGKIEDIESGRATIVGRNPDGSVKAEYIEDKLKTPTSTWVRPSHNAETGGTLLLNQLIPNRKFPFPKSLYAVEDAIRLFIGEKKDATVLDFFSGSGTTAHAVMRLNHHDGGVRQCISITNNEVSPEEQKSLRQKGLRPGDFEWEKLGICNYITKPRVKAAITGKTPDGQAILADYKFTDKFPMSEGFEENAEFFTLTYEAKDAVNHNLAFSRIAPLLWMRAGARGKRINKLPDGGWAVSDTYGLLAEVDKATPFVRALREVEELRIAYIVTDDDRRFQAIARRLPEDVEPVRLYESYLTNFSFANGE